MKIIFVTASPSYLPDAENLGHWSPVPGADGFFMLSFGDIRLFVHECLSEQDTKLKQKSKHAIVASWLSCVLEYAKKQWGEISKEDLFVIQHDKDLLKYGKTDEGIYREQKVVKVKGGLENMVKDGNIYLFQHVVAQDMYIALINDLYDPSVENVEKAINVIKQCKYETPYP